LLIFGFIAAFFIWFAAILPVRVVKPIDFTPAVLTDDTYSSLETKIDNFKTGKKSITLDENELCAFLKTALEKNLGIEISALATYYNPPYVTAFFKIKITDIPSSGFLSYFIKRKNTEYTTTTITAKVNVEKGGLRYSIIDFRIGNFKIPDPVVKLIAQNNTRNFHGIYLSRITITENSILIEQL